MSSLKDQNEIWRSLSELEDTPEFRRWLDNEFPEQEEGDTLDPLSRRRFMQLMGASLAFAGVAGVGCKRYEQENIVPLARRPEDYVPGVPSFFASGFELAGSAIGILGQSYDGRPTKIEGNPSHPFSGGASTAWAQASILELYDPDRSQRVMRQKLAANWNDFETFLRELGTKAGSGAGVAVLSEATDSPTVARLRAELQRRMPQVVWHEWEPLSRDNVRLGTAQAFGQPARPLLHLDRAQVVLTLDDDLFLDHPAALRHGQDYARVRRPDGPMTRVYAVESTFTTTGTQADHRLPLRSELVLPLLMALDARFGGGAAPNAAFLAEPKVQAFVDALAADLQQNRGRCVISAGYRQPPEVHALVARVNESLGNIGRTVTYVEDPNPDRPTHFESITALTRAMQAGQVQTLLILGGNPAYNAPADLDFAGALAKVPTSVHLSLYHDETSALCTWHVPRAHYLESWGDARSYDGTVTIVQPLIEPLYQGKTPIELLALLLGQEHRSGQELVRATFDQAAQLGDRGWRKVLHDGFVVNSQLPPVRGSAQAPQVQLAPSQTGGTNVGNGALEVVFTSSLHAYDGRFANNGWLLETPDPMTKVTWDNPALIGPSTADALGIKHQDRIRIRVGDLEIDVAAYVMPGQAPGSITLPVGHGRTRAGVVGGHLEHGVAPTGFDTYKLRTTQGMFVAAGANVTRSGLTYDLASTQDHWNIDRVGDNGIRQRLDALIRVATKDEYQAGRKQAAHHEEPDEHGLGAGHTLPSIPSFLHKPDVVGHPPLKSLWKEWEYEGHKWGMATDLGNCINCNACMVACQAENNVPIVGKTQVMRSREMHWIRIDRYFKGDPNDPQFYQQPMLCQQCETAPCESVCPVGATLHSTEGLNDMVYNRCVGTRYCANNCPYKVRRFNFLEWNEGMKEARNRVRKLLFNPEVTVRERGVMEKCTWCVQRIQAKKIEAKNERRVVRDGEIVPACAQACPTQTIVFGDLNDDTSRVAQLHKSPRAYALLGDLNTKPRNAYLARIRNPNPALG